MIVLLNFNTFKIDDAQKRQIRKRAFLPFSYGCAQAGYGPYQHYIKTSINNIAGLKSSQLLMPCHLLYLLQPSLLYNSTFVIVYKLRLTQWFAPLYIKDSAPEQREACLSFYIV